MLAVRGAARCGLGARRLCALRATPPIRPSVRWSSAPPSPAPGGGETLAERNQRIGLYALSVVVGTLGVCYASVPLYKVFCQATGFGGTTQRVADDDERVKRLTPAEGGRILRVSFDAQVNDSLPWSFAPCQRDVRIVPGETSLAFYTTKVSARLLLPTLRILRILLLEYYYYEHYEYYEYYYYA